MSVCVLMRSLQLQLQLPSCLFWVALYVCTPASMVFALRARPMSLRRLDRTTRDAYNWTQWKRARTNKKYFSFLFYLLLFIFIVYFLCLSFTFYIWIRAKLFAFHCGQVPVAMQLPVLVVQRRPILRVNNLVHGIAGNRPSSGIRFSWRSSHLAS